MQNIQEKIAVLSTQSVNGKYIYKEVILINLNCFHKDGVKTPIQYFTANDQNEVIECEKGYNSIHLNLDRIIDTRYNSGIHKKIICYAKYLTAKGVDNIIKEAEGDDELMQTVNRIEDYSKNARMSAYYDYDENKRRMILDSLNTGIRRGREQGISIGRTEGIGIGQEQGKKGILKTMSENMPIHEISRVCNMSEESIINLINS